ncbi:LacI family DNA-binding transcriptional regulator [Pelagicoccus sp. SDUM812005]|nr:LacI family DNA-binding transcriptional regulator [Pelagicoccus sp. SDUM812005]
MPGSVKPVRQIDIAMALGISQTTVSLVMRGDARIPKKTREKVLSKARQLSLQSSSSPPCGSPSNKPRQNFASTSKPSRIGQAQIARELGLSQSTVSEALRGRKNVSVHTRAAVLAKAEELGYVPDPNLVALSNRRSSKRKKKFLGTLAWVTNHDSSDEWRKGETTRRQYNGVAARSAKYGYKLEEFWLADPNLTNQEAREILLARGIRGLILAPQPTYGARLDFDFSDFSAVTFGTTLEHPLLHRVGNHLQSSTRMAYQKLKELGYKTVSLCVSEDVDRRTNNCVSAGYLSMKKQVSESEFIPQFIYRDLDKRSFLRWFEMHRPDGILTMSWAAATIRQWLESEGLKIGEDFGIAVLNWHDSRRFMAGIDQMPTQLGEAAVDVIHRLLRNSEYGIPPYHSRTLLSGVWRDGDSAAPRITFEP